MWGGGESEQPGGILDEHITASPVVAFSHLRERGGILCVVETSVPHHIACLPLFYSNVLGYGSRAVGFGELINRTPDYFFGLGRRVHFKHDR